MASLILSGSTSGSVTLSSPAVSGTTTLTLPTTSGTVITTGTTGQVIASGALPIGSVLQVVNASFNTQTTTTSTSFVATFLTASITPKFSTSKILVITNGNMNISSASYVAVGTIYRNSTNLGNGNGGLILENFSNANPASMSVLDSPATTSSTTYTAYIRTNNASGTVYFGDSIGGVFQASQITLMEIAA
jgi:hypothetical protein